METKRAEIKAWLARTGRSYQYLADELEVSLFSVNGWMSKNNIPKAKLTRIEQLMAEDAVQPAHKPALEDFKAFPIMLTKEDYKRCENAAQGSNQSLADWAADILAKAAEEYDLGKTPPAPAASAAPAYDAEAQSPYA